MSIPAAVLRFARLITVRRAGAAAYSSAGVLGVVPRTTLPIRATVQPATGRDLKHAPEGASTSETIVVFSPVELRTLDDATGTPADVLEVDGLDFEIVKVECWGSYWRALAQR